MSLNDNVNRTSVNAISCFLSPAGSIIVRTFGITNVLLLLPLSILVCHVGFQRWRQQRSTFLTRATSHTDIFTYNMVVMEMFTLLGCGLFFLGEISQNEKIIVAGFYIVSMVMPGQTHFHGMACIDRYLAVVHPVTYLALRQSTGVHFRNIIIACVWLMCSGWLYITYIHLPDLASIPFFSFYSFSLLVSSYCSLSVLRALWHPSPGEKDGDKVRVDPSKQRAFYTVMAIMGALWLKFVGFLICLATYCYITLIGGNPCLVLKSSLWFILPSSVVLPLLFLHRADKLPCFKRNAATMQGPE